MKSALAFFPAALLLLATPQGAHACNKSQQQLRQGDIVFLEKGSALNRMIARTTNTWTSHVGVAFEENGRWVVYHATSPTVRKDSFCAFLATSTNHALFRYKSGLSESQVARMLAFARKHAEAKTPYDETHQNAAGKTHCSKFAYDILSQAGLTIGRWQSFLSIRDEFVGSPQEKEQLLKAWDQKLGLGGGSYFKLWWAQTVTPASQLRDSDLTEVRCTVSDCTGIKR